MTTYRCTIHGLELKIDEQTNRRTLEVEALQQLPDCELLRRNPIPEGRVGACLIERVVNTR